MEASEEHNGEGASSEAAKSVASNEGNLTPSREKIQRGLGRTMAEKRDKTVARTASTPSDTSTRKDRQGRGLHKNRPKVEGHDRHVPPRRGHLILRGLHKNHAGRSHEQGAHCIPQLRGLKKNRAPVQTHLESHEEEEEEIEVKSSGSSSTSFSGRALVPEPPATTAINQTIIRHVSSSQLVQAQPVVDRDPEHLRLQQATQVDPDAATADRGSKIDKQQRDRWRLLIGLQFIIFVGIVLTIVLLIVNKDSDKETDQSATPMVATKFPFTAPSAMPTSAPTGFLDVLFQELPTNTQTRITTPYTHQYNAWNWLYAYDNATTYPLWRQKQLFALATFYYAFEGDHWPDYVKHNWLRQDRHECYWFNSDYNYLDFVGNFVDDSNSFDQCNDNLRIEAIFLEDLLLGNQTPTIPPEIALLTSLTTFFLRLNDIQGTIADLIPTELALLPNLRQFSISYNSFSGSIPSELGLLATLERLDLHINALTGTVPTEVGQLSNLKELFVYDNALTGRLPSEVGRMSDVVNLHFHNNTLTGRIVSQLGMLSDLNQLYLQSNLLTGPIPTQLGQLPNITRLHLHSNAISGRIPSELGQLTSLQELDLSNLPLLAGPIPTELALLYSLGYFQISGSPSLSGTVPESICHIQNTSCVAYDPYWTPQACFLSFDCSDRLCGCNCDCSNASLFGP